MVPAMKVNPLAVAALGGVVALLMVSKPRAARPAFHLSSNSERILSTVHPDLQRVVRRAIRDTSMDFAVVSGRRTVEEQLQIVADGFSGCKPPDCESMHLKGLAVDLAPIVDGAPTFDLDARGKAAYFEVGQAMKAAADAEGVPIKWLGESSAVFDPAHFQLQVV